MLTVQTYTVTVKVNLPHGEPIEAVMTVRSLTAAEAAVDVATFYANTLGAPARALSVTEGPYAPTERRD